MIPIERHIFVKNFDKFMFSVDSSDNNVFSFTGLINLHQYLESLIYVYNFSTTNA